MKANNIDQQNHWDKTYNKNTDFFGQDESVFAKNFIETLQLNKAKTILEIGAGQGRDTVYFAKNDFLITAIDYSKQSILEIQDKASCAGLASNINPLQHDLRKKLDFPDNTFDACYAHMLLCMQFDWNEIVCLLNEVYRVLKNGGIFSFSVRNVYDKHYEKGIHIKEKMYTIDGFTVHFFDEHMLNACTSGYDVLHICRMEEGSLPRDLFAVTLKKDKHIKSVNK